ncbi:MAG: 50S ribosomal protein L11 methyltransferase [Chitinophagales bacterium]|nr:50S ribosomal protein L11 methyltransferase [Chitinophagales bacterium]
MNLFEIPLLRKYLRKFYYTYSRLEESYLSSVLSPQKEVLGGIFRGLKYPAYKSSGSSLFCKLLGSYEDELHPTILELVKRDYKTLIDVGCAEGYYAVGLARMLPDLKVYAYDTDSVARKSCSNMAKINGVSERVIVKETCTSNTLVDFSYEGKTLIVCDCEGYEAELFNEKVAERIVGHDVIIELHENVVPNVKQQMIDCFSKTHNIAFVGSRLKMICSYPDVKMLPIEYRQDKYLYERGTYMEWAVITSKS